MDKLIQTLNNYLGAAQHVVAQYGPGVWQATLTLIRLQGIFAAVGLIVLTAASIIGFILLLRWCRSFYAAGTGWHDREFSFALLTIPGIGVIASIICWANSLWVWLSILSPKLEVIYQLAGKAGLL